SLRPAGVRAPSLPGEPGPAPEDGEGHRRRGLHRHRREGARRQHARSARPPGAHALRIERRLVRRPLLLPPRPGRRAGGAGRAAPGLAPAEVPVNLAAPWFLLGTALALAVGGLLLLGGVAASRARARFGDLARVQALVTFDPAKRRAWKGVILVLAVA